MKSFGALHQETNALHYDFLMLDMKTAGTFLDIVQTTQNAETRTRNLHNAATAYATVLRLSPRVSMTTGQAADFRSELGLLKNRIASFDQPGPRTDERAAG